jgi:Tol biopolymer transport system component
MLLAHSNNTVITIRCALSLTLVLVPVSTLGESQLHPQSNATAQATLARATFDANARTLALYDRRGTVVKTIGERAYYRWPALSPVGRRVVFVKQDPGSQNSNIWVVDISTAASTRITTAAAVYESPIWSPDGRHLAYVDRRNGSDRVYRKAADGTGDEELLYQSAGRVLLTDWSSDGQFLSFSSVNDRGLYALPLERVGAAVERKAIELFRSDKVGGYGVPVFGARFSPDGRFVAYRSNDTGANQIWVRRFKPSSGETTDGPWQVTLQGAVGMVSWRRDGKELYYLDADRHVMAVTVRTEDRVSFETPRRLFDAPDTTILIADYPFVGAPEGLGTVSPDGQQFLFAATSKGKGAEFPTQLTVFDRQGKIVRKVGKPGNYSQPLLSNDGKRLAAYKGRAMWIFDLASGRSRQVTPSGVYSVSWSPDDRQIAYVSYRDERSAVYQKPSTGIGDEVVLYTHPDPGASIPLTDWSPDGRFLSFNSGNVLWTVSLSPLGRGVQLPSEAFNVFSARFSPDGRFVAYVSDESGRNEIYVRPFNASTGFASQSGKWQVSRDGGLGLVQWRRDGRELYYLAADGRMMAVEVMTTPTFQAGAAKSLFQVPDIFPRMRTNYPDCSCATAEGCERGSVSRDGQRFVFAMPVPPDRREVPVAREILESYAGTYTLSGRNVTLALEGDRLTYQAEGARVPLFAESETTLFFKTTGGDFEFFRDDTGTVSYFLVYTGESPRLATRVNR